MKERRGDGVLPLDIAEKCAELYDIFEEEENWGAQETGEDESAEELALESAATNSPRHQQPAVRTQGSVLERLSPTDNEIWGLGVIQATATSGHTPATSLAGPDTTSTTCRRREEVDSEV